MEISPSSWLKLRSNKSLPNGYVVRISTYTHHPLEPQSAETSSVEDQTKTDAEQGVEKREDKVVEPGITGKDIMLALRVEEIYTLSRKGIIASSALLDES